jgi:hypothetical protein
MANLGVSLFFAIILKKIENWSVESPFGTLIFVV